MQTGVVFDIKEFAVHDGPGVRTTVFLKGCPLRCRWCHNPEGLSPEPQILHGAAGDRLAGRRYTSEELAALLNRQADLLRAGEGGVTFSGGEPLRQAAFVAEVIDQLDAIHTLLDTSGFAEEASLRRVAERVDLVYFDLKLADPAEHRQYTGVDNDCILRNLRVLDEMNASVVVRVPLVPGITDTDDNLAAIAQIVAGTRCIRRVDLLPYNRAAGGKYAACGMAYRADVDESRTVNANTACFAAAGLEVQCL
jgi:pyruvate formate lyase activating enzyme